MVAQSEMMPAARKLVGQCTNVQQGESVLVITDPKMTAIAEAIAVATREKGAEPVIAIMDLRSSDSTEPPRLVAEAMKAANVIFSAVSISITHTRAVKDAVAAGSRAIALTAVTEEMMVHGGLEADFEQVKVTCEAVGARMASTKTGHITSEQGTDLTFRVEGRRVNVMPCVVGPGEFSPAPTAEVNFSPIEGTANGIVVADASIPYLGIGLLKRPVRFAIRDGFIVGIEGGDPVQVATLKAAWEKQADPNVYNVAEMGIGMNPSCRFTGLMLEDEGVLGSIHIGTGTNITLGGVVKARSHYDLIMSKPTLELDGEVLIENGQLRI